MFLDNNLHILLINNFHREEYFLHSLILRVPWSWFISHYVSGSSLYFIWSFYCHVPQILLIRTLHFSDERYLEEFQFLYIFVILLVGALFLQTIWNILFFRVEVFFHHHACVEIWLTFSVDSLSQYMYYDIVITWCCEQ